VEGPDDGQLAVDVEVHQGRHPALARLGARRGEQQQGGLSERPGDLAAVGPELVDDALVEIFDNHGIRKIGHARSTGLGLASIPGA
jgi:hypothetical protein